LIRSRSNPWSSNSSAWTGSGASPRTGLARHVLLVDPEQTSVAPLVQALLLAGQTEEDPFWQRAGFGHMCLSEALGPVRTLSP